MLREAPITTRKLIPAAFLIAAGGVACAPGTLSHFDGRPFENTGPLTRIGSGWVAVDSCATGIHAMVELEVDGSARGAVRDLLSDVGIALDAGVVRRPTSVKIAGPFCWVAPSDPPATHEPARVRDAARAGMETDTDCTPVYIVRAEFDLQRLPRSGEAIAIVQGNRRTTVAWTRR